MSPRQELLAFAGSGNLRQATESKLTEGAADLLVTVVLRYCESRRPGPLARLRRANRQAAADRKELERLRREQSA